MNDCEPLSRGQRTADVPLLLARKSRRGEVSLYFSCRFSDFPVFDRRIAMHVCHGSGREGVEGVKRGRRGQKGDILHVASIL